MTEEQEKAIENFFVAAETLKTLEVIRSDKYLGDIAEFICKSEFGLKLAINGRQPGYDGHIQRDRVQVKYSGGTSTTVDCGNPDEYEELIVVIGPKSKMRSEDSPNGYVIYRIPSSVVKERETHTDGRRRYTKNQLPEQCRLPLN